MTTLILIFSVFPYYELQFIFVKCIHIKSTIFYFSDHAQHRRHVFKYYYQYKYFPVYCIALKFVKKIAIGIYPQLLQ
jgi:hypothetical protein